MKNKEVVEILKNKKWHISCAESCTGGLLCSAIVDVPQASAVLDVSFVAYAEKAKETFLNVESKILCTYGVVSEEVARAMVLGVCKEAESECGISITGVAGPTGGTKDKPVGMVCYGFKILDTIETYTIYFGRNRRNTIRKKAVVYAINQFYALLKKLD